MKNRKNPPEQMVSIQDLDEALIFYFSSPSDGKNIPIRFGQMLSNLYDMDIENSYYIRNTDEVYSIFSKHLEENRVSISNQKNTESANTRAEESKTYSVDLWVKGELYDVYDWFDASERPDDALEQANLDASCKQTQEWFDEEVAFDDEDLLGCTDWKVIVVKNGDWE